MSTTPSYDEARRILKFFDGHRMCLTEGDAAKAQICATLAVAESLMAIEGLLRAQDARARKVERENGGEAGTDNS